MHKEILHLYKICCHQIKKTIPQHNYTHQSPKTVSSISTSALYLKLIYMRSSTLHFSKTTFIRFQRIQFLLIVSKSISHLMSLLKKGRNRSWQWVLTHPHRLDLTCFYDNEQFMCLCTEDHNANCFLFDFNMSYACQGYDYCEIMVNAFKIIQH